MKRSASEALPSSVSSRYSLSIRTHGSSCRRRASSSLRRVRSFSASSSSSRAARHSSRVPVLCFLTVLVSFLRVSLRLFAYSSNLCHFSGVAFVYAPPYAYFHEPGPVICQLENRALQPYHQRTYELQFLHHMLCHLVSLL